MSGAKRDPEVKRATAELLEDRGEAAACGDFFRSRPFLDAEGVTHTLRIAGAEGELLAPLIVREIGEGPERDAISPYGYPGIVAASEIGRASCKERVCNDV